MDTERLVSDTKRSAVATGAAFRRTNVWCLTPNVPSVETYCRML